VIGQDVISSAELSVEWLDAQAMPTHATLPTLLCRNQW